VIGTSMQVYPAASLIHYIPENCEVFVIDPNLDESFTLAENNFKMTATQGMKLLKKRLLSQK